MTKIDIISGFLGAGKTTLIKKLLAEALRGEQVVLIENEFGEIGIDGGFLQESGIEIREMNSGCICCSLVGDFGTSLKEVITTYHPDRIVIEPSGVGKLSDVIKAVENVHVDADVSLNSYTTVVDVNKCKMYMRNFGEFFENQIAYAKTIILSRTDLPKATEEKVAQVIEQIRGINKDAVIVTTPIGKLTGEQILQAMEQGREEEEEICPVCGRHHDHEHHHDHEDYDECCHDHEHHHDHDDDECCHDHEHHHDHDDDECCHDHEHHHHHDDDDECCHDHEHHHHHDDDDECCHDHEHHHHHDDDDECCHDHEHHHDHDDECCHDHEHHHHHDDDDECCHDHEHHHDNDDECCHDHGHHHHHHHHADEIFVSWGCETAKKYTKDELQAILQQLSEDESLGVILRAKGMVDGKDGEWIFFDMVPEEYEIRTGAPQITGKLCVIGSKMNEEKIAALFGVKEKK